MIGSGVSSIGDQAFYNCDKLNAIKCLAMTPPTCGNNVFNVSTPSNVTLYVLQGATAYETTEPWKNFKIVYIGATNINNTITNGNVALSTNGGNINLSGVAEGTYIDVYGVDGRLVRRVKANGTNITIEGLTSGNVYIMKIGSTNVKVLLSE